MHCLNYGCKDYTACRESYISEHKPLPGEREEMLYVEGGADQLAGEVDTQS